ncbi:MAG TPA: HDOD domain-containing protein, partial [Dehalococcoidia bacterium]|nr:HDOD domain-containing protein [Dehalococcoidia bacterium]
IGEDMATSSKILQLTNSAFFGVPRRVTSAEEAVSLLGIERVKGLVLANGVFSRFEDAETGKVSIEALWRHSAQSAAIARGIAKDQRLESRDQDSVFTAAFLHDVGKLILALNLPDAYAEAMAMAGERGCPEWEAEAEVIGATHAEVGAYLLALWGLPAPIVDGIAWHHRPAEYSKDRLTHAGMVHIASGLAHEAVGEGAAAERARLDEDYLRSTSLAGQLSRWRQLAGERAAA